MPAWLARLTRRQITAYFRKEQGRQDEKKNKKKATKKPDPTARPRDARSRNLESAKLDARTDGADGGHFERVEPAARTEWIADRSSPPTDERARARLLHDWLATQIGDSPAKVHTLGLLKEHEVDGFTLGELAKRERTTERALANRFHKLRKELEPKVRLLDDEQTRRSVLWLLLLLGATAVLALAVAAAACCRPRARLPPALLLSLCPPSPRSRRRPVLRPGAAPAVCHTPPEVPPKPPVATSRSPYPRPFPPSEWKGESVNAPSPHSDGGKAGMGAGLVVPVTLLRRRRRPGRAGGRRQGRARRLAMSAPAPPSPPGPARARSRRAAAGARRPHRGACAAGLSRFQPNRSSSVATIPKAMIRCAPVHPGVDRGQQLALRVHRRSVLRAVDPPDFPGPHGDRSIGLEHLGVAHVELQPAPLEAHAQRARDLVERVEVQARVAGLSLVADLS